MHLEEHPRLDRHFVYVLFKYVCIYLIYIYIDSTLVRCPAFYTITKFGDIYHEMRLEKLVWMLGFSN